ncbi:MAG: hypothetical protein RLZZ488_2326 [Pseudomonadota bacterium]
MLMSAVGLLMLTQAKAVTAADICKQQTIFGIVGTKSCVGQDDGNGVVPAVSTLTSVENLPNVPAVFSATDPTGASELAKVCNSQNLLGDAGTAVCSKRAAMNHRNKAGTQSVLSEDFTTTAPNGRLVAQVKDDDGGNGTNVNKFNRTGLKVCGTNAPHDTLAEKIADCLSQNGEAKSSWAGIDGNAGEGNWTLVQVLDTDGTADDDGTLCDPAGTPAATCTEIWRDDRTGLLWSDRVSDEATDVNWCKASGANSGTTCADVANQPDPPESLCAEGGTPARTIGASFNGAKGGFRLSTGTINVRWWLPTRADWMQAEENGIRFVLPNIAGDYWTSTTDSSDPNNKAWIFKNSSNAGGGFETFNKTGVDISTRCIGQAL